MKSLLSVGLICAILTSFALPATAQQGQSAAFFEALYDVPVMAGLEELKDQAMLFDKPDGRIASVVAASKSLKPGQVTAFYAAALPQLGWKKQTDNQYVRGEDVLYMEVVAKPPLTVIHFTLSPVKPAVPKG